MTAAKPTVFNVRIHTLRLFAAASKEMLAELLGSSPLDCIVIG
jgi:hypothetical protein